MEILKDKLYLNRTWKYIYPALRVYGTNPINYLNSLIKLAVGIQDINFKPMDDVKDVPKIFILLQTQLKDNTSSRGTSYGKLVTEFFNFIRIQPYYVDDYLYDIKDDCCLHMVVIKLPESFKETYSSFKTGDYENMYHHSFIEKYFPVKNLSKVHNKKVFNIAKTVGENLEIHDVLLKSKDYEETFLEIINNDFGVELTSEDIVNYDYPPLYEEEVFNYSNAIEKIEKLLNENENE